MFSLFHHSNRTLNKRNFIFRQLVLLVQLFVRPFLRKILHWHKIETCPCDMLRNSNQWKQKTDKPRPKIIVIVDCFRFSIKRTCNQIRFCTDIFRRLYCNEASNRLFQAVPHSFLKQKSHEIFRSTASTLDIPSRWNPRAKQSRTVALLTALRTAALFKPLPSCRQKRKTRTRMCSGFSWCDGRDSNPRPTDS